MVEGGGPVGAGVGAGFGGVAGEELTGGVALTGGSEGAGEDVHAFREGHDREEVRLARPLGGGQAKQRGEVVLGVEGLGEQRQRVVTST